MPNRCFNDPFYYCFGEPQAINTLGEKVIYDYIGQTHSEPYTLNHCINNHSTCPFKQTFTKSLAVQHHPVPPQP